MSSEKWQVIVFVFSFKYQHSSFGVSRRNLSFYSQCMKKLSVALQGRSSIGVSYAPVGSIFIHLYSCVSIHKIH